MQLKYEYDSVSTRKINYEDEHSMNLLYHFPGGGRETCGIKRQSIANSNVSVEDFIEIPSGSILCALSHNMAG